MIDNRDIEDIFQRLEILEEKDAKLAQQLMREFNQKTAEFGKIFKNLDAKLDSVQWKKDCDKLQMEIQRVVERIKSLT